MDEPLENEKVLNNALDYTNITMDEVVNGALLFAALYGTIYGKWYEDYFIKCTMEMKKFYINLGAREMGNAGAATPERMAKLFDLLLYEYSEKFI